MSGAVDWTALRAHGARLAATPLASLIAADPARATRHALRAGPLYANVARQRVDDAAFDALIRAAETVGVPARLRALFDGEAVNATEGRAALHSALRSDLSASAVAREAHATAAAARLRMREVVAAIQASGVTDVVSVGIGGSDLGPRFVVDAIAPNPRVRVHFLSNVDPVAATRLLSRLDPAATAGILISKTFGTQETLLNGALLRDWLGSTDRLYAVSANVQRAADEFGIPPARILPMWDWVGGRYSLWSAVGLPIALAAGVDAFDALLAGAAEIDAHVLDAPLRYNLPVVHALLEVFNRSALGHASHAVIAYADALRLLPAYLQQLVMESLGKRVAVDGRALDVDTVPVWWGGVGTDVQHSFFQALHQGTQALPIEFIGVRDGGTPHVANADALLANLLAQAEALANGRDSDDPHRAYPGGRPSTMLLLDRVDARNVGALLAMYEHSVFVQSVLWGINAFDQFGVELGKQVATGLLPALGDASRADDPVTRELITALRG